MDLTHAMRHAIQERYGDFGWSISKFRLCQFDLFSSAAIIQCTRTSCEDVVEACCSLTHVGFERVCIKLLKVSGKLTVCKKYIKQMIMDRKSHLTLNTKETNELEQLLRE